MYTVFPIRNVVTLSKCQKWGQSCVSAFQCPGEVHHHVNVVVKSNRPMGNRIVLEEVVTTKLLLLLHPQTNWTRSQRWK